jgi:DNA-binding CsgD family transcriptional regulator
VLLLNRGGQVVFANRAAYAALAREDGLMLKASLTSEGHLGYLTGETPAITRAIEAEVASALQSDTEPVSHFGSGLAVPQATGKGQWIIRVAPLTEHGRVLHGLNTATVMMFLHDTSSVWTLQPDLLKQMYGLTLAESRVAQALLQHGSPAEIAHVLSVGESTIRSQLKAIFEKTNTHRQADLVKLLMGIAKSEA